MVDQREPNLLYQPAGNCSEGQSEEHSAQRASAQSWDLISIQCQREGQEGRIAVAVAPEHLMGPRSRVNVNSTHATEG